MAATMMTVMVRRRVCLRFCAFCSLSQAGLAAGLLTLAFLGGHGGSG